MSAIMMEEMVRKIDDRLEKLGKDRVKDQISLENLGTRMGFVEDALKASTGRRIMGDYRVWITVIAALFGGSGLGILGAKAETPATAETIHQIERLEHAVSDLTEKIEAIPVASTRAN